MLLNLTQRWRQPRTRALLGGVALIYLLVGMLMPYVSEWKNNMALLRFGVYIYIVDSAAVVIYQCGARSNSLMQFRHKLYKYTMNAAISNDLSSLHAVQTVLVCTVASQSVYVIELKFSLTEEKLDQEARV